MKWIKRTLAAVLIFSLLLGNISFAETTDMETAQTEMAAEEDTGSDVEDVSESDGDTEQDGFVVVGFTEEEAAESGESDDAATGDQDTFGSDGAESQADAENSSAVSQDSSENGEAETETETSAEYEEATEDTGEETEDGEESEAEPITGVYYEWQTLEEVLELCGQGLDLSDFFRYTIWTFLTEDLIRGLVENGHTLDDVYEAMETENFDAPEDILDVLYAYAAIPRLMSIGDTRVAGFSGSVSSSLDTISALGNGSHGPMLKIHLSGETAFCAKYGAACRTGMVYTSVDPSEIGLSDSQIWTIRALLTQYGQAQAIYNGPVNYIMTQASIWMVINGTWTGDPEGMAASISALFSKTPDCPSAEYAEDYFKSIVAFINDPANNAAIAEVGLEAWMYGPNQYLITATGGSIETVSGYAHIEITKVDSETGNVIADDAEFTIYEWNGSSYEKSDVAVNRDGNKYISDDLMYTDENEGKFYVVETSAPHTGTTTGYYGDFSGSSKNKYEFEITEDMQGDTITIGNSGSKFVNERVTGSITVYKKDIEADAYITGDVSHGIATLDGAIYDLYAAEDIIHPDGVTGTLYSKGTLVASGTISGGSCSFTNLYLGSYYVKERQKGDTLEDGKKLSYATGYLLDEYTYYVTLPYEGEATANVHRDVTSDKEQVIKAKAVIEKVENATGQGNINYLEGAGFTIYRIDKLSKVDATMQNADGTYDEESILAAYLVEGYDQDTPKYDFSGEDAAIATLYIRDTDMREDTAFYWQDAQADIAAGKLLSLGNHYYQVAELFTDENGQVTTPYLPYGQYLVVETTVPEDHFMSAPFVLTFNKGKTTTVLTTGVTEETPYGSNILKSSGDTTASYEAVYFSQVVDNEAIEELLKIYKKDTDTGETVLLADTQFKIAKIDEDSGEKTYITHTTYYPDTVNRDVFSTNAEGYLQLPELLAAGLYQIEEVEGPNGFFNDVPGGYVQFRVTTEREYVSLTGSGSAGTTLEGNLGERDVILIIEDYYNYETRGLLTLKKQGEVLTGYKTTSILESIKELLGMDAQKQFVYEELPLAGAEYTIYAAEDIVTQDRQTDEKGNRTLWFEKGDVVAVITTGEDGQIDDVKVATADYPDGHPIVRVVHDGTLGSVQIYLPLGSYTVEETKAPYGYTRSEETCTVTFTWDNQYEEYVFNSALIEETEEMAYAEDDGSITYTNARVKVVPEEETVTPGIGIYKSAKENGQPLSGVTFGLYTVNDIYTRDEELLAEAGELLSVCETGEDGTAVFDIDVPIRDEDYGSEEKQNSGEYQIVELSVPSGVELDSTPISVTFTYVDDKTEYVVIAEEQENVTSEVFVSKQDVANWKELAGATLTVTDKKGKTVQTWVSDGTVKEIRGLSINESVEDDSYIYTLKEEAAPEGYTIAESIRFKLVAVEPDEENAGENGNAAEDTAMNTVYVYDTEQKAWVLASDNIVIMKDEPGTGKKNPPDTPGTPDSPGGGGGSETVVETVESVQTGDNSLLGFYAGMAILGLCASSLLFWYSRRRK
ncbi:MAG: hypothetical protein LUC98_11585 [Lachnospiraceae bacterium]|nr:hypothetical protein [Lachnospiraceae bacterium]